MIEYINVEQIAENYKKRIREIVEEQRQHGQVYSLYIISAGNNERNTAYMKGKKKDCEDVGIFCFHYTVDSEDDALALIDLIQRTSPSQSTGIILQSPAFDEYVDERIFDSISYPFDVDFLSDRGIGATYRRNPPAYPATATGVKILLGELGQSNLTGKSAVVVGRGPMAGAPTAKLLQDLGATVTTIHTKTSQETRKFLLGAADLVVLAAGVPGVVKSSELKDGCLVVDLGITKGEDNHLHGDLENNEAVEEVPEEGEAPKEDERRIFVTPVPKGMGLLTRVGLLVNLIKGDLSYD